MSEPMTSGEIEDVLSSIRKLVSEDLRPQVRPAAPIAPREPGKLILTPALRVVEGNAEAEATLAAMPEAEPEPESRPQLDTVVSSFAAWVSPPADGWEPETGDATVTRLVRTPPVRQAESGAEVGADPVVEAFPDASVADDSDDVQDAVLAEGSGGLYFAWQARRAEIGAAEPGEDDALIGAGDDDILPGADETPDAPMLDLDSDALADLVRDILRDELQGAMGERMTRNIRKLVRAEVARILATRDLA